MTTVVRGPAVLATGILALTLLATSPVSADPGDLPSKSLTTRANAALSTPAEIALMKNQAAIDQVANRIKADEKQSKASTFAGLSGVVVDAKANTLHLYWHGPLSASASREVAAARNTGMAVTIHPAPFTLSQLKAERDHIADVYMSDKALSMYGFEVVSVGPKPDGSGLEVGVSTSSSTTLGPQPLPQISSTVAVQVTRMAKPQAAWRILDTQPYWGGTYMERWSVNNGQPVAAQAACTMGFSVTAGGSRAGMLTANHCGRGSWFMVGSGTPTLYGSSLGAHIDNAHDAQVIGVPSSQGGIYDGESVVTGDTNTGKPVASAAATNVGNTLCTSGSFSGTQCGGVAVAVDQTINMGGYGQVTDMVRAEKSNGFTMVGNGDSGGPVFSNTGEDNSWAIARGTVSAIPGDSDDWGACHGVPAGPDDDENARHCSWRFWYPDITVQLAGVNATIRTL